MRLSLRAWVLHRRLTRCQVGVLRGIAGQYNGRYEEQNEVFLALALGMMDGNLARLALFWSILRDPALDINCPSSHIVVLAT
jgi:hypothetical protein